MVQFYHYSIQEIEFMTPWERNIYVALIRGYIEEEEALKRQRELDANF